MGDNHENVGVNKVPLSEKSFLALMEAFSTGLFFLTYEFRIYNFQPEFTPLLAFVDSLTNNLTLQTIGFAKNNLDKDICAAIIQRLYFNASLTKLDLNSNPISQVDFIDTIMKPYFNTRKDLQVVLD